MGAEGEASEATVFEYNEHDGVVCARYEGGAVRFGFLVGTRTGWPSSLPLQPAERERRDVERPLLDDDLNASGGRLRLDEDWEWEWESKPGAGTSAAEEVPRG
jgi:hypothetical protein